nr:MAG TPA: hypothetical protein [Caudoviricetes sp.]
MIKSVRLSRNGIPDVFLLSILKSCVFSFLIICIIKKECFNLGMRNNAFPEECLKVCVLTKM